MIIHKSKKQIKRVKEFLKSKSVLYNIAAVFVFFLVISVIAIFLLKIYTRHGQAVNVPVLKGLPEREVDKKTDGLDLRYKIVDSVYMLGSIPGTVVAQYPEAGTKVKENRIIYITLASREPEKVLVPKVIDVSLREAESRLENAGLRLGQVVYRPSEFLDLVLEQHYKGRPTPSYLMLPRGTYVDLVVGRGLSGEKTTVPNLRGISVDEARIALYNLSLNIGVQVYDNTVVNYIDSAKAIIWKQRPDTTSQSMVELGTSIDVWLTVDPAKVSSNSVEETVEEEENDYGF